MLYCWVATQKHDLTADCYSIYASIHSTDKSEKTVWWQFPKVYMLNTYTDQLMIYKSSLNTPQDTQKRLVQEVYLRSTL